MKLGSEGFCRGLAPALALLLSGCLSGLHAQDSDSDATDEPVTADSVQLVFEREVFTYPMFERRNPFQPQTGDDELGPRFEDLVLLGVVLDPDPTNSIAVIGARPPGATSGQAATRAFRLRRGQMVGNARVIDIQRRQVLMEVNDFGVSETRVLDLARGTPPPPVVPGFAPTDGTDAAPQSLDQSDSPDGSADGAVQQGSAPETSSSAPEARPRWSRWVPSGVGA